MKLKDWRDEIDVIDGEIIRLLSQRTKIVRKIGVLKAKAGLPVIDRSREDQIIQKIRSNCTNEGESATVCGVYKKLLHESREIQYRVEKDLSEDNVRLYR